MRPGITLAMIVRNEERCLARCLESAKGCVDAIAVVDTGSNDGTIAIAQRFGAKVFEMEWPGAFDAARNASLDLVETEWTLWLDADEWLAEGAAQAIRQAAARSDASCYFLVRRDMFPGGGHGEMRLPRLWRSHPKVRFTGVIHEQLSLARLETEFPGKTLLPTDIAFWHDGPSFPPTPEKLRRYVEMLRRELELRPGQLYPELELANTLAELGEPEAAEVLAGIAERLAAMQDLDEPPHGVLGIHFSSLFGAMSDADLRSPQADALVRLGRGWFPNDPGVQFTLGQLEVRRGNLLGAYAAFLDVERMAETGRYDRSVSVNPAVFEEALWTNLGIVAQQLGKRDVAIRNYHKLLARDPTNSVAIENLARL